MRYLDKKYIQNIGLQGSGNTLAQLINIISLPVVTRLFAPDDFGKLSLFIETLALFTIAISLRVEHIIMLPKKHSNAYQLFSFVYSYGFISTLIIILFIFLLVFLNLIPSQYILWVFILPVTSFFVATSHAAQQLSQRSENFKNSAISDVINRFSNSSFVIISGIFSAQAIALGLGVFVGFLFKTMSYFKLFKKATLDVFKNISIGYSQIKKESYWKLLVSLIISHALLAITTLAPLWYISYRWGGDFLGYFTLVLGTLVLPSALIGRAVGQVFFQRASSDFNNGNSFKRLFEDNMKLLMLISIVGFSFVFFFSPVLYPYIFGSSWYTSGLIAQYYVFAAGTAFVSIPFEKTALIVNAWWYGPSWYIARVISVLSVIYFVDLYEATFFIFIFWLTMQIAIMHLIDISICYLFSCKNTPFK